MDKGLTKSVQAGILLDNGWTDRPLSPLVEASSVAGPIPSQLAPDASSTQH